MSSFGPANTAGIEWLHTDGNKIVTESGQTVVLRGVNIENREWVWEFSKSIDFEKRAIPEATAAPPDGWGANIILLAVASGPINRNDATYLGNLDQLVALAKANGAYTLLVYRYAEPNEGQPTMPDQAAEDALAVLAARYANEPAVLYGLQVEPHDVTWDQLKPRFTSMIDAIRAKNSRALVAVPGTQWGRYVHWALTDPLPRRDLVYKIDYYDPFSLAETDYKLSLVAAEYPVILSEFGAGSMMGLSDVEQLLDLSESLGVSWIGWLFHEKACPCMLKDASNFSTTGYGAVIKERLQGVAPASPDPAPTATPIPTATPPPQLPVLPLPIREGDVWRYFKGSSEPPVNWPTIQFNDSRWQIGPSGFGYGDGDDATILPDMQENYASVYLRRAFSVVDPSKVTNLTLTMDYDDSFVAYLNGVEVARANVAGTPPPHNIVTGSNHEASRGDTSPQPVETFDLTGSLHLLAPGENVLAIQGHNRSLSSSDFTLIPTLTSSTSASPAPDPTATPTPTPIPLPQTGPPAMGGGGGPAPVPTPAPTIPPILVPVATPTLAPVVPLAPVPTPTLTPIPTLSPQGEATRVPASAARPTFVPTPVPTRIWTATLTPEVPPSPTPRVTPSPPLVSQQGDGAPPASALLSGAIGVVVALSLGALGWWALVWTNSYSKVMRRLDIYRSLFARHMPKWAPFPR